MKRRDFILLTLSGLCVASQSVVAAVNPPTTEIPLRPAVAGAEVAEEPFPISLEDYSKIETEFVPRLVEYPTEEAPGTIIIDPDSRYLYLVLGGAHAKRYGIGVGREGFGWSGAAAIKRKSKWPMWFPPEAMQKRDKEAARWGKGMPGGPRNPLGARALYLYQGNIDTLYRIHGTREPKSIGHAVSSGCIRMLNADIVDLFDRVPLGTKVVVLASRAPVARSNQRKAAPREKIKVQVAAEESQQRVRTIKQRLRQRSIFQFFGMRERKN